ncbi:MAG TPA: hypothetical protein VNB29_00315 [Chthoniobacterales bacterium]|nr:hypothetical protein [Chthoniobacterales bacterium]
MEGGQGGNAGRAVQGIFLPPRQKEPARAILYTVDASETMPEELMRFWRTDDGMTACQRAEAYGIDLSLLDENLRLTPAERMQRNDDALALVCALQEARTRAKPEGA